MLRPGGFSCCCLSVFSHLVLLILSRQGACLGLREDPAAAQPGLGVLQAPGGSDPSLCSAWACQSCSSPPASSPSRSAPCPCWVCRGPQPSCLNPSPSSRPGFGLCPRLNPSRSFPVCDAAGITFPVWVWSCFLSPGAKCRHSCGQPSSAAAAPRFRPSWTRGSTGGKGRAGPSCDARPRHIPEVCEQLGRWEGDTRVVTSMSLVFLDVTAAVSLLCGSRDGPAAAPGLIPKVSPEQTLPAPRFGASPISSAQVFLSVLTLPPWEGEGRSSLFPAEPMARAFTSTTDHSKTRIKESFPGFFPLFHSLFVLTSDAQNEAREFSQSP